MDIEPKQLKGKPKKVGKLEGDDVYEAETKGGLHFLVRKSKGGVKTLGTGSHPAVARSIAERDFPKLTINELSKSESLDPLTLKTETAKFLPLTRRIQALEE